MYTDLSAHECTHHASTLGSYTPEHRDQCQGLAYNILGSLEFCVFLVVIILLYPNLLKDLVDGEFWRRSEIDLGRLRKCPTSPFPRFLDVIIVFDFKGRHVDNIKCHPIIDDSFMGHNNRLQNVPWLPALFVTGLVVLLFGLHHERKIISATDFPVFYP